MAKSKINYSALKKTADSKGVMFCKKNEVNYLFNSFCIIRGLDDVQFEMAIEKSSAKELPEALSENFDTVVDCFNDWFSDDQIKETVYTYINKVEKDKKNIEFFKIKNNDRDIVLIDSAILEVVKKEKTISIKGLNSNMPLCFELPERVEVFILPVVNADQYIDSTNQYTNKIKNFLKEIDCFY